MPQKGVTGGTVKATASPPTVGTVQSWRRYPKELDLPAAMKLPELPKGVEGDERNEPDRSGPQH